MVVSHKIDDSRQKADNDCLVKNVVYMAEVHSEDTTINTYIGLTENQFKTRFYNHNNSFKDKRKQYTTELSKHIWKLKESNKKYEIKWSILKKTTSYCNTTKRCMLCLWEKYFIQRADGKMSLNKRTELFSGCRHAAKFTLGAIT